MKYPGEPKVPSFFKMGRNGRKFSEEFKTSWRFKVFYSFYWHVGKNVYKTSNSLKISEASPNLLIIYKISSSNINFTEISEVISNFSMEKWTSTKECRDKQFEYNTMITLIAAICSPKHLQKEEKFYSYQSEIRYPVEQYPDFEYFLTVHNYDNYLDSETTISSFKFLDKFKGFIK